MQTQSRPVDYEFPNASSGKGRRADASWAREECIAIHDEPSVSMRFGSLRPNGTKEVLISGILRARAHSR